MCHGLRPGIYFNGKKVILDSRSKDSAERFAKYSGYSILKNKDGTFGFYNTKEYGVDAGGDLRYKGESSKPEQPINIKNCDGLFYGWEGECLDLSNWDVSEVIDMSNMFEWCRSLKSLDIGNWNVNNVTSMFGMFKSCKSLTSLDIGEWNVNSVTDMGFMFYNCSSLKVIDVSNWGVNNVGSTYDMFAMCKSLSSIDIVAWNINNVLSARGMFRECDLLPQIFRDVDDKKSLVDLISWCKKNY